MIQLTQARHEQLEEVAAFIAARQQDPAHFIGYFDTTITEVIANLRSYARPWSEMTVLAHLHGRLVGMLGVDYFLRGNRCMFQGPFVDYAAWDELADQLYAYALRCFPPPEITMYELFADTVNDNVWGFASRHGYKPYGLPAASFVLKREQGILLPPIKLAELTSAYHAQFTILHHSTFPTAYLTAPEIIERGDALHKTFIVSAGDTLLGYVHTEIEPTGAGYMHCIAVRPDARGQHVGQKLMLACIHWLFSIDGIDEIKTISSEGNTSAITMFRRLGFTVRRSVLAYRKYV